MSDAPSPPASQPSRDAAESTSTFADLGLHADLLKGVRDLGFVRPTPIQTGSIPVIFDGRDLIGLAQTGTGKTAAFVLPILQTLMESQGRGNVRTLIVAPTRELALQSMDHLKALSRYVSLKGAAIFGGVPMEYQIKALAQGLDIISATPGRLLDHIYSGRIDFVDLRFFVLDEVDRMLDMGFLPDIRRIIELLPQERQTLVFSATMPKEIASLVHEILRDPVTVQVGERSAPAAGVRHAVYPLPRHLKIDLLVELLRREKMTSVLVFSRTKIFASRLAQTLERRGVKVSVIHGDRSQSQRLSALDRFRRGRSKVMVATDVAARGIDIAAISHVVNFDVPHTPDGYVHRIGRTARAEATGDAITLMDPAEEPLVQEIEQRLGKSMERIRLEQFPYGSGRPQQGTHKGGPSHGRGRSGAPARRRRR